MDRRLLSLTFVFVVGCKSSTPIPDPTYQGRPASEWINLTLDRDMLTQHNARLALLGLGNDAVPQMLKALESDDPNRAVQMGITLSFMCPTILPALREALSKATNEKFQIQLAIQSIERMRADPKVGELYPC